MSEPEEKHKDEKSSQSLNIRTSDNNNEVVTPESLRQLANNWSLAGDKKLLQLLENTHKNIVNKCEHIKSRMEVMSSALDKTSVSLQNVNCRFSALGNTQFIESRVYDDDLPSPTQPNDEKDCQHKIARQVDALSVISSLGSFYDGLNAVDDKDLITMDSDKSVLVKLKDPYRSRPLPQIIGSELSRRQWHSGWLEENSESDSLNIKERDADMVSERDDESSIDEHESLYRERLSKTKDSISTNTLTSEESEHHSEPPGAESNVFTPPPLVKPTAAELAAELSRRLAGAGATSTPATTTTAPTTGPDKSTSLTPQRVTSKPAAKAPEPRSIFADRMPVRRISANTFFDEPPPIDDTVEDEESDTQEDDIFADLRTGNYQTKNIFSTTSQYSGLFDDIPEIEKNESQKVQSNTSKHVTSNNDSKANSIKNKKDDIFKDDKVNTIAEYSPFDDDTVLNKNTSKISSLDNSKVKSLFDDDDEDDIFADVGIGTRQPIETKQVVPISKSKGLFESDDEDDLFSDNTKFSVAKTDHKNATVEDRKEPAGATPIFGSQKSTMSISASILKHRKLSSSEKENDFDDSSQTNSDSSRNLFGSTLDSADDFNNESVNPNAKFDQLFEKSKVINSSVKPDASVPVKNDKIISSSIDQESDLFKTINSKPNSNLPDDLFNENHDIFNESKSKIEPKKLKNYDLVDDLFGESDDIFVENIIPKKENACDHDNNNVRDFMSSKTAPPILDQHSENIKDISNNTMHTGLSRENCDADVVSEPKHSQNITPEIITTARYDNDTSSGESFLSNNTTNEERKLSQSIIDSLNAEDKKNYIGGDLFINSSGDNRKKIVSCETTQIQREYSDNISSEFTELPNKNENIQETLQNNTSESYRKIPHKIEENVTRKEDNNSNPVDDFFSTIFDDQPPVLKKSIEPKKSKNINALFDDDSEDEGMFLKQNDDISIHSEGSLSIEDIPQSEDQLFSLFHPHSLQPDEIVKENHGSVDHSNGSKKSVIQEPQDDKKASHVKISSSVNMSTESNNSSSRDVFEDLEYVKTIRNDDVQKGIVSVPSSDKSNQNMNESRPKLDVNKIETVANKTDVSDVMTSKNEKSPYEKSIGKLKPMNLNINMQGLLPGALPKKNVKTDVKVSESNDLNVDLNQSKDNKTSEITTDVLDYAEPVKSISFDNNPESPALVNIYSKERAKIKVKRRPSTRKGRQEAFRNSTAFEDVETIKTDNLETGRCLETSQSSDNSEPEKGLINTLGKIYTDGNTKQSPVISHDKNIRNVTDVSPPVRSVSIEKTSVISEFRTVKSTTNSNKLKSIFDDDSDEEKIFSSNPKKFDGVENVAKKTDLVNENKSAEKLKTKAPSSKTLNQNESKMKSLFDSDLDDDDLFGAPKTHILRETKIKNIHEDSFSEKTEKPNKNLKKRSLFDDDDSDDDLFGTSAPKMEKKPQVKRSTALDELTSAEQVFHDPLSFFD